MIVIILFRLAWTGKNNMVAVFWGLFSLVSHHSLTHSHREWQTFIRIEHTWSNIWSSSTGVHLCIWKTSPNKNLGNSAPTTEGLSAKTVVHSNFFNIVTLWTDDHLFFPPRFYTVVIPLGKMENLPKYPSYYHPEDLRKFPAARRPLSGREGCESWVCASVTSEMIRRK